MVSEGVGTGEIADSRISWAWYRQKGRVRTQNWNMEYSRLMRAECEEGRVWPLVRYLFETDFMESRASLLSATTWRDSIPC